MRLLQIARMELLRTCSAFRKRPSRCSGSPTSSAVASLLLQTPAHHNLLLLTTMLELHRTYCPTTPFLPLLFSCTLWHLSTTYCITPVGASFDVCSFGNETNRNGRKRTVAEGALSYDSE
ncbi:hypothetical protein CY34DRAFT_561839 [Suillus luteus UH-Slu-Lm8-n1]|uniref:Uncharacterized protein n=1 Tax=Suillus luteus UH-Slu-Lm8-n1 TaxID=930992 RepID=A0A0D0AC77_9AGAM|nr:hypothetical protein CY34DRAFT_561839 [Suillus luteus UH-Slu-Lm8-n1]